MNGVEGETIYIDTEGSFEALRVKVVAQHFLEHLNTKSKQIDQDDPQDQPNIEGNESAEESLTLEKILKGIHCFRIYDYIQQLSIVYSLPQFLQSHPMVRLIILDSVSFHFRRDFKKDYGMRTR